MTDLYGQIYELIAQQIAVVPTVDSRSPAENLKLLQAVASRDPSLFGAEKDKVDITVANLLAALPQPRSDI